MQPIPGHINSGMQMITPVAGLVTQSVETLIINREEVEDCFLVKLSVLTNPQYHGYTQFRGSKEWYTEGFSLPVYWGGKHVIWGLTAMITYNFISVLFEEKYNHK